jgi:hypothetical protein
MNARLNDRDLTRVLDAWFDEGPMTAADTTLDRVMGRIPTVRQRSRVGGAWTQLPWLLRTQAPMLASLAVLVTLLAGLAVTVGIITRPGPAPNPPPPPSSEASVSPRTSPSADATPALAESEAVIEEIRGPVPLRTFDNWVAKSRDLSLGQVSAPGEPTGVHGYVFTPDSTARWFTIYLDPTHDYPVPATTERDDLRVLIGWNFSNYLDPDVRGSGSFVSDDGECVLSFEVFTEAEIAGTIDCIDVPGSYSTGTEGGAQDAVIGRLLASFSFDPVLDVYEPDSDG